MVGGCAFRFCERFLRLEKGAASQRKPGSDGNNYGLQQVTLKGEVVSAPGLAFFFIKKAKILNASTFWFFGVVNSDFQGLMISSETFVSGANRITCCYSLGQSGVPLMSIYKTLCWITFTKYHN